MGVGGGTGQRVREAGVTRHRGAWAKMINSLTAGLKQQQPSCFLSVGIKNRSIRNTAVRRSHLLKVQSERQNGGREGI